MKTPPVRWIALSVTCMAVSALLAWPRLVITDEAAVADAELIVVATLIPESVRKIEHERGEGGGRSWHHRVKLKIVEVLKGRPADASPEVILHYGLDPVTGRCLSSDHAQGSEAWRETRGDSDVVGIWDSGGLDIPITGDVRQPHLWLLSRKDSESSTPDENDVPGAREPAHIQSLAKKEALVRIIQTQSRRRATP